ncbi:MAG: UDP-3-O-(3-hydroxymyristoyl)glucosamine N-acyltransferase [Desulfobacterales bacterium]|jgi:UDP-3-O-[3-hydroxymyristoyl] glucosamine N-acyltransferase|nr:UDP-3-O-(3-hydroxymyristoyl)glucosamine N-acyltransferase [Desulfobacterales bacterium]
MELTIAEIAHIVNGDVCGDATKRILRVAAFDSAGADDVTFAMNPEFEKKLASCAAGAVIVSRKVTAATGNLIRVDNPHVAFAKIIERLHPAELPAPGIHTSAVVGHHFCSGKDVSIAACAVIGNHVVCGSRVTIYPCVVIGDGVVIGDDVVIYPNVTIYDRCRIGNRVTIHAGTVIGSEGFGFAPDGGQYHKVPQVGIVQIDDDVELGALNTIDRAALGKTWIQRGVKTDNQVHVAHNVVVGEDTIIVAQTGIAGSVTIGKHVIILGKAGVADHLTIGDNAVIGNMAGIGKDVAAGEVLSGAPAMPHRTWLRVHRDFPSLPGMKKKMDGLEKRLSALEKKEKES